MDDLEKTIGRLFFTASSFVHHFKAIGEFKLELQSGNIRFGSKSAIFCPSDREILWMTLKNNRAPLPYYIKLCASFQNHGWIQTGITVQKLSILVKIGDCISRVTWKFDGNGKTANLFSLLLYSLWWVQIFRYVLACRSYSYICTVHHLIISIVQTYLKALNL